MNKKIVLGIIFLVAAPITSMELEEIDLNSDESEQKPNNQNEIVFVPPVQLIQPNIPINQAQVLNRYQRVWPFKLCPEAYEDMYCNKRRDSIALEAAIFAFPGLLGKGILSVVGLCCIGASCKDACQFVWVGNASCDSCSDGTITGVCSFHTASLAASCILMGCAYQPCWNGKGCTKKKNKELQAQAKIVYDQK